MTREQYRKTKAFARKLDKLAAKAAELDLVLGNGGDISSMLGAMAADLETQAGWQRPTGAFAGKVLREQSKEQAA